VSTAAGAASFDDGTPVDVLVVGGGPAGAATAAGLARQGHRVVVIDREERAGADGPHVDRAPVDRAPVDRAPVDRVPVDKACGELVTPRAVSALGHCGIGDDRLARFHRTTHIRLTTDTQSTSVRWPQHDDHPQHGYVVPRARLDALLLDEAVANGAVVLHGHEATGPIVDRGFVRGAHVAAAGGAFDLRARFTVVADGANSRFGRALGTYRDPRWPYAAAHRAIHRSALHDASEVELVLDLADRSGTPITGFGWMFPRGDGTVNVGVLIMSTSPSFRVINPAHLLDAFVHEHGARWRLDPQPVDPPAGGRIPLGRSVGPVAGPTYLVVGDAAGAANPMSGAGIEYALETGMLAGGVLAEALRADSATALQRYPQLLDDRYGSYHQVGRLVDRLLGRPSVARRVAALASSRASFATPLVRLAGNELRARYPGLTELSYRLARAGTLIAPDH
jgi:flavin-dependent dehydrogenase